MPYESALLTHLEANLRQSLPKWGVSSSSSVSLLSASENATFLAKDEHSGSEFVFRVHRPGYQCAANIRSELAWSEALRMSAVVETPVVFPALDGLQICSLRDHGDALLTVAFQRMSGRELATSDDLVKWYRRLGEVTASLHRHSRSWRRPAGFDRRTWDVDTTIGSNAVWGDWRGYPGLRPEGLAILSRTATLLDRQISAYGCSANNFGLIHADMRPANLMVDGERLGLIDFDDCGQSWFMFDFAAAVSFSGSEDLIAELQHAWLDGYRRIAPLSEEDEAMLPVFVMLRRIQLIAWITSHAETATARARGPIFAAQTIEAADRYLVNHL